MGLSYFNTGLDFFLADLWQQYGDGRIVNYQKHFSHVVLNLKQTLSVLVSLYNFKVCLNKDKFIPISYESRFSMQVFFFSYA